MITWGAPERRIPRLDWFPWACAFVVLLCLWSGWETFR